jgi:hypothetical protein
MAPFQSVTGASHNNPGRDCDGDNRCTIARATISAIWYPEGTSCSQLMLLPVLLPRRDLVAMGEHHRGKGRTCSRAFEMTPRTKLIVIASSASTVSSCPLPLSPYATMMSPSSFAKTPLSEFFSLSGSSGPASGLFFRLVPPAGGLRAAGAAFLHPGSSLPGAQTQQVGAACTRCWLGRADRGVTV